MRRYRPSTDDKHETVVMEKLEDSNQQDLIAELDIDQHAQVNLEFQQLLNLNTELRTANNDLYVQVEQLKTELAEAEKILQWQKTRSSVTESMFKQQSQELSAAGEQIQSLYQQLEVYVQTVQRQEICIETYKSHLEMSQQRLAHLERECSLLQSNYSQESQQLLQSENTCRELQTRLMRQQRQTLQFKSALEKCLDTPIPSPGNYVEDHIHHPYNVIHKQTRFSRKARSLFPNAQPIQPWSGVTDSLSNSDYIHNSPMPSTTTISDHYTQDQEPFISQPITDKIETVATSQILPESLPQNDITHQLFTTPLPEVMSQATAREVNIHHPDEDDTFIWKNLLLNLEDNEQTEITITQDVELEINPLATHENDERDNLLLSPAPELPITSTEVEMEDYWLDVIDDESLDHNTSDTSENKSPSPLIYPQRPPKGRKSLASVELPSFRPKPK
jgi:DNA polymerase III alpha subunit (gram-positive type)